MIQIIEAKGLSVTAFESQWKEDGKISVGYLAASAKNNRNIGIHLVEHFLEAFPETDVNWLVTGRRLSRNTEKKHTPATKSDEAAKLRAANMELLDQIAFLSTQNSELSLKYGRLAKLLLDGEVIEQSQ